MKEYREDDGGIIYEFGGEPAKKQLTEQEYADLIHKRVNKISAVVDFLNQAVDDYLSSVIAHPTPQCDFDKQLRKAVESEHFAHSLMRELKKEKVEV